MKELLDKDDLQKAESFISRLVEATNFQEELTNFNRSSISTIATFELAELRVSGTKTLALSSYVIEESLLRRAALGKTTPGVELSMPV